MATAKRKRPRKSTGRKSREGGAETRDGASRKRSSRHADDGLPDVLVRIGDEFAAAMREVLDELAAWWR